MPEKEVEAVVGDEVSSVQSSPLGVALANQTFNMTGSNQSVMTEEDGIIWSSVGMGIVLSMGQVHAANIFRLGIWFEMVFV